MRVVSVRYKCIHLGVIRMTFKDVSLRDIGWLTCETTFRRHTGKQLNSWPARWRTFPENSKEAGPFFHIYICLQSTLRQLFLPSCTRMGKRLPYPSSVYHPYIHFFFHTVAIFPQSFVVGIFCLRILFAYSGQVLVFCVRYILFDSLINEHFFPLWGYLMVASAKGVSGRFRRTLTEKANKYVYSLFDKHYGRG